MLGDSSQGQGRVGVRLPSRAFWAAPGSSVSIAVLLHNRSAEEDFFSLSVQGIPTNWVAMLSPAARLAPGEQREVTLVIQPPRFPQTHAGRYPFKIRVVSQGEPDQAAVMECSLTVASLEVQGRIGVLLASTHFSVVPGSSTTIPIVLINQGLEDDFFQLSVEGIPVSWVSTPAAVIRLSPGEQQEVTLTVQPPRAVQSRAGRHRFKIQVISRAAPGQMAEAECILTVAAFTQFSVGLNPRRVDAGQTAWVTVENRGNIQQAYTVTWQSHNDELAFEPAPAQELRVPIGEVGTAQFRATPRWRPFFGDEVARAFTARVQSAEGETQNLNGEVISRGLMPVWMMLVLPLLGLAVVCVLAFILYRGLSEEPTATQTAVAQVTPSPGTPIPTEMPPTEIPTPVATQVPTELPTEVPTAVPTEVPTETPTATPEPTELPTELPTEAPTETPTELPTETPVAPPIQDLGVLAFESNRDGNPEIYSLDTADGSLFRLTIDPAADTQPAWSPDGGKIAFATNRDGNYEIYTMNADGTAVLNLTNNPADDLYPTWSPDGGWIAFTTDRDGNQEIYIMRPDGSEARNVTNSPEEDYQPSWFARAGLFSTDERITFTSTRDGNPEIYAMKTDGSEQVNLTNNPANDVDPAWSPDGNRLVFTSNRDGNQEVYVMIADGADQINLTNNPADDMHPAWSPDGQWIAFATNRDGNYELYVMASGDGSQLYNSTNNGAQDRYPAWVEPGR